jgi:hypothetical protein
MLLGAAAGRSEHTQRVGLIQVDARLVAVGHLSQLGQTGDVPFHAKNPVGHDELRLVGREGGQRLLQMLGVVVVIAVHLHLAASEAYRQHDAVHDRGVVVAVAEHVLLAPQHGRDGPQVGQVAGRKNQGRLAPHEMGQAFFQLHVLGEGAVDQAGAGTAGTEALHRFLGRFLHARVHGQAQVVVGADHDDFAAVHYHPAAAILFNRDEVGVKTALADSIRILEVVALAEYVHRCIERPLLHSGRAV